MQWMCNHSVQELLMPLLFCPSRQCDVNLLILKAALMCLVLLLSSLCLSHAVQVSAVEVHTPEEMFVENGTDAKLPCTFTSVEVISSAASVSWSFQPEGAATRISVSSGCRGTHLGGEAGMVGSKEQANMDWLLLRVPYLHHCDFRGLFKSCRKILHSAASLPRLECAVTTKY